MVGNNEETINLCAHYDCLSRGNFNITNDNSALNINVHFHRDASKNHFPGKYNSYPCVHCNKKLQKDEPIIQIDNNSQKYMHNDCLKNKLQLRQNRKLRALENFFGNTSTMKNSEQLGNFNFLNINIIYFYLLSFFIF